MRKITDSLKEVPVNGLIMTAVMFLYCLNRFYLMSHVGGWIGYLLKCHFNDLLCGILFTAYSNVIFNTRRMMLTDLTHILAYCFCAGLVWEFVAPCFRKDSVADWIDIICYMLGGLLYWLILRESVSGSKGYTDEH